MIFLGAGASKTFGIKTLQEMSKDLIEFMKEKGHGEIVQHIEKSLNRFGLKVDFEAIYTIVEAMIDPILGVKRGGPLTAYVCKDSLENFSKTDFEELLQSFNNFLLEQCKPKYGKIREIISKYDELFKILKGSESRIIPESISIKQATALVEINNTIVTTNYDMIVELYHRAKRQKYSDGFELTDDEFTKELDLHTYTQNRYGPWLIKLHGSVWMYKYQDRVFKTTEDPKSCSIPVEIEQAMMIYPTKEKPILEYPYYDFYHVFKTQPWLTLVSIGYSFRDTPVNLAIFENLQRNKNSKIIMINPDPDRVIPNFETMVSRDLLNRIIPVKGKFGESETNEKLELALKVDNAERYYTRLLEIGYRE